MGAEQLSDPNGAGHFKPMPAYNTGMQMGAMGMPG